MANAVVRVHSQHTGRGPTRAQVYTWRNVVIAVMRDAMTKGERSLAKAGHGDAALRTRRGLQETMRHDLVTSIEQLTGCHVIALLSDNRLEPDIGVQLFVLDRVPDPEGSGTSPEPA
jgi:uncharacterized protein YbcI